MKNRILVSLLFASFFSFVGCASTKINKTESIKENIQPEEKLRFIDWKYKGFGQNLPDWVAFAIDGDENSIKNAESSSALLQNAEIKIIKGVGKNYDQAENSAKLQVSDFLSQSSDFELFGDFWVKENDDSENCTAETCEKNEHPYIAVYVYFKKIEY